MTGTLLALLVGAVPTFDHAHGAWSSVLGRHVRDGRVDYAGLSRARGDLDAYLATLQGVTREGYATWNREERLAFWINAYNAYTIRLVLDHYPVSSIKKIGGLFKSPFAIEFIPLRGLRGKDLSLNDVEHEILRREFDEPRIHFAIVCASKGCPPLRAEAYRAADLDRQLDENARAFLADREKNRIDLENRTLYLSPIFEWFEGDFVKSAGSVPAFVARFVDEKTGASLRDGGKWSVKDTQYDWDLNGE
jgi:hypothetical protein